MRKTVSSILTSSQITGLDADTCVKYNVSVVVVAGDGTIFRSADVLAMTDRGIVFT